jgi:hypothetical protein
MLARIGVMRALKRQSRRVRVRTVEQKASLGTSQARPTDDTRYLGDLPTVVASRELARDRPPRN